MARRARNTAPASGYPPQVAGLLARAAQSLRDGRPTDAVVPLREAASRQPGDAAILHDLGLACLQTGRTDEAVGALRFATAADPRFADAHLRLGIALEAAGQVDAALAAYQAASAVLPSLADARYRAGNLLETLGRTAQAAEAFRRAAASAAKTRLGRIASARALLLEGRDGEAERLLRQALALDSRNAAALDLLGNILADAGRFEEARAVFGRAIEAAPLRAGSYYDLVRCGRIGPQDGALVARIGQAAALPGLEPAQRARVHLALGKAADDLGDPAEAMRHFDTAEALRNTVLRFDLRVFEARVDHMIARFTPEFVLRHRRTAQGSTTPVVIVGLPRSGTTLVEQILSAHPDVRAGGELAFWGERAGAWEPAWTEMAGLAAEPALTAAFLDGAAADYLRLLHATGGDAARVTDKMPLNLHWAGLIHLALPRAVIVHCGRRPVATALSIHQTHFNPRTAFPTGGPDLVGTVRAAQRLAAHWRRVLPAEQFVEVEYEALTDAPEPAIRRLLTACGLAWHEACLHPDRNTRLVKTASKWQARQPITTAAAERWRAYVPYLGPLGALLDENGPAGQADLHSSTT